MIYNENYTDDKVIETWDLDYYLGMVLKYIYNGSQYDYIVNRLEYLCMAKEYLNKEIDKLLDEKEKLTYSIVERYKPKSIEQLEQEAMIQQIAALDLPVPEETLRKYNSLLDSLITFWDGGTNHDGE